MTAVAAWIDRRTGEIPNVVSLAPLAAAPIAHAIAAGLRGGFDAAIQGAGASILGALLCAIVPFSLYRAGAMGGGDVKTLAAVGALMRPLAGIEAELYACLAGAILASGKLAYEGKLFKVLGNTLSLAVNPLLPKNKRREVSPEMLTWTRFGPAIFAGTLVAAVTRWRG